MDKTHTIITVHRVFGEKETLSDLLEAYILEQTARQPTFDAANRSQDSQPAAVVPREEAVR